MDAMRVGHPNQGSKPNQKFTPGHPHNDKGELGLRWKPTILVCLKLRGFFLAYAFWVWNLLSRAIKSHGNSPYQEDTEKNKNRMILRPQLACIWLGLYQEKTRHAYIVATFRFATMGCQTCFPLVGAVSAPAFFAFERGSSSKPGRFGRPCRYPHQTLAPFAAGAHGAFSVSTSRFET